MFRVGESPKPGQRYTARPGVYAVLRLGDKILVTAQTDAEDGLDLQLPGGGIDMGESPVSALHREVFEETGWHIASPRRLGAFRRFTYMPEYDLWAEKICMIYTARPVFSLGPPIEPGHRAVWLEAAQAPEMLGNLGDRAFVAQELTGVLAARYAHKCSPTNRRHILNAIAVT
ncbi:MAG: NUDIX hydrolase [Rhodobacteraceae bacterium]|nr:NUDIX hydrolase [Paracoccaceae bacterium]